MSTSLAGLRSLLRRPQGQVDVPRLSDADPSGGAGDAEPGDGDGDGSGGARQAVAGGHEQDEDHVEDEDAVMFPALLHTYRLAPARGTATMQEDMTAGEAGRLSAGKLVVQGIVRANPALLAALQGAEVEGANPKQFPMVVPPRPWTGVREGGYLRLKVPIVRPKLGSRSSLGVAEMADMPQVYDALNVLGAQAWRVNPFVHETMRRAWEGGGGLADLPPRADLELPEPPPPPPGDSDASEDAAEAFKAANQKWRRQLGRVKRWNSNRHSLRCDLTLKLAQAKAMESDAFWFPYNMDFRGRVYPVPPHLNHMGSDICRGLVQFARPKQLGDRGLYWLKVQLSNLMGNDKAPLDERAQYAQDNLASAMDSADRPLDGNGWWLEADSPWQALAACKELTQAMRLHDPTQHSCPLPVHQDGSCNGLQHYAALGRDYDGAVAVNLVDADRPQDVYSRVLDLVIKRIEKDAHAAASAADRTAMARSGQGGFAAPVADAVAVYEEANRIESSGSVKQA